MISSLSLHYTQLNLKTLPTSFIAKIGTSNEKSLALFDKLGFTIVKTSEVFEEHELRFAREGAAWQTAQYAFGTWPVSI